MEPVFYIMAVLGCGDASGQCTAARTLPTHYTSVQQCRAAAARALAGNTDLDYPSLSIECRAGGAQVARVKDKVTRG